MAQGDINMHGTNTPLATARTRLGAADDLQEPFKPKPGAGAQAMHMHRVHQHIPMADDSCTHRDLDNDLISDQRVESRLGPDADTKVKEHWERQRDGDAHQRQRMACACAETHNLRRTTGYLARFWSVGTSQHRARHSQSHNTEMPARPAHGKEDLTTHMRTHPSQKL